MIEIADLESKAMAALSYLYDNCAKHAQDRANSDHLSDFLKVKRAELKSGSTASSNAAAEDAALCHPDYLAVLEGKKTADTIHHTNTFKRQAAEAIIGAWQTCSANSRHRVI